MECLGAILGPVVAETCSAMCSRHHRDMFRVMFRSNPKALNTALQRLKEMQTEVTKDHKKLRIQEKPLEEKLGIWLSKVKENQEKGESILKRRCSRGRLFSRKIMAILKVIKRLEEEGQELISTISMAESSIETVETVLGPSFHPQTTATQMLDKIKSSLKKKDVQKIGVWGMGGVGKTTLVRTLNNELKENASTQQFGLVIWVTVSKDFNLTKIQMDIANRLGEEDFTTEEKKELGKSIHKKLAKLRSFLLILDDVWKPIDLESLGIPLASKNSKVVLTSRRLEVCQQMMTDENITVECLQEQEAWEFFCHNAGEVANSVNVKRIAENVCRECGGLPLAIITIGRTLRGKGQVEVWKHALNMLKRSTPSMDTEEKIFGTLKFSYDFLQDKMKSCFLYCALYPEDYSIKVSELVRHWVVEEFLEGQDQYEDLMNEGVTLVEILKDSCLLENGNGHDAVKMHDVVRDFAIWIMSSPSEGFHSLVMAGRDVQNIRRAKFVPSVQRVSLIASHLDILPNCLLECAETSVLLLQENSRLKEVPDGFLSAFPNLRILNLSGTHIINFPNSFSNLHNLQSLLLRETTFENLPSLESLVKLEYLDLHDSDIREFPRGLEALSNLRYIFLSKTRQLESIPAGSVRRLSSLEVLDMADSGYKWGSEGLVRESQATLEEVTYLTYLQFLAINLPGVWYFSDDFNSLVKRLRKFQFLVNPPPVSQPPATGKRYLLIRCVNVSQTSIGWLMERVTSLDLDNCEGVNYMFKNLVAKSNTSFAGVKSLSINECPSISLAGGCKVQRDLFPNLEELSLTSVDLESIEELNGILGLRFQKLKLLYVKAQTSFLIQNLRRFSPQSGTDRG